MISGLTITVDSAGFVAMMSKVLGGLDTLVERVAEEFADVVADEASGVSARLGATWPVEGAGPTERHVIAPEWWAHFLAGGTQSHGPASSPKLVFSVGGNVIFADFVAGTPASHFDERAIDSMRNRVDTILDRIIATAS